MPPKRKTPATKKGSSLPAQPSSNVLQPKSSNTLKRPLSNDIIKESNEISQPKSKRRAPALLKIEPASKRAAASAAAQSTSTHTPSVAKPMQWNGTGKYNVTSGKCIKNMQNIDTTGFSLKVFYCKQNLPHQVWAAFCFDKLEGLMRLCPRDTSPGIKLPVLEFENLCYLRKETIPGPENQTWAMRWKGRDGGMQANKIVGEEEKPLGAFLFQQKLSSPSPDFVGVQLVFFMIYQSQLFRFEAMKTADLDSKEVDTRAQELERRWVNLYNPQWDADSDSTTDSDSDSNDSHSDDSDAVTEPAAMPRGSAHTQNILKRPEATRPKPIPGSLPWPLLSFSKDSPDWAWDVTGKWVLSSNMLKKRLDLDSNAALSMNIMYSKGLQGRQLWATYEFGDALRGTMRFNPESNHGDRTRDIAGFEKACILKKGVWPGPSPGGEALWRFRYRGDDIHTKQVMTAGDICTSSIEFKVDDDGKLCFEALFIYKLMPVALFGVKDTTNKSDGVGFLNDGSLEKLWGTSILTGSVPSGQQSAHRLPKVPTKTPVESSNNQIGLWKDHPGKSVIENPSDWAWNLAGHWTITSPELSKALLGKTENLSMKIHVSNFPNHSRVGRQLWASFEFGDALKGYMRFCPFNPSTDFDHFDDVCRLESGQWPGPKKAGGHESWSYKWRAKTGLMTYEEDSDYLSKAVEFSIDGNGKYAMEGYFVYRGQTMKLNAVKDRESTPPRGIASSILNLWDNCRTKKKTGGGGRYIVSVGYGGY